MGHAGRNPCGGRGTNGHKQRQVRPSPAAPAPPSPNRRSSGGLRGGGCCGSWFQQCPHRRFYSRQPPAPRAPPYPTIVALCRGDRRATVEHQSPPHRRHPAAYAWHSHRLLWPEHDMTPPGHHNPHARTVGHAAPPNHRCSPHACTDDRPHPAREWDGRGREDPPKRGLQEAARFWETLYRI
jgi:hypothetical protein